MLSKPVCNDLTYKLFLPSVNDMIKLVLSDTIDIIV